MKKFTLICLLSLLIGSSIQTSAQTKVRFYTTKGNFDADLYDIWQPITSGNFISLINAKFYDGIIFHRVISGFMIQGGDPTGTGSGGPGYTIADEFDANASNVQKTLSMANSGPNTGGSQFFINLVNNIYLNPNHPVFGIVTTNFNVVQTIGAVPTNTNDKPLTDVVMDSIRILSYPVGLTEQLKSILLVEISPNPVNMQSNISIKVEEAQTVEITICNIAGMAVHKESIKLTKGINIIPFSSMNIEQMTAGIYFVTLNAGQKIHRQKILLNK